MVPSVSWIKWVTTHLERARANSIFTLWKKYTNIILCRITLRLVQHQNRSKKSLHLIFEQSIMIKIYFNQYKNWKLGNVKRLIKREKCILHCLTILHMCQLTYRKFPMTLSELKIENPFKVFIILSRSSSIQA